MHFVLLNPAYIFHFKTWMNWTHFLDTRYPFLYLHLWHHNIWSWMYKCNFPQEQITHCKVWYCENNKSMKYAGYKSSVIYRYEVYAKWYDTFTQLFNSWVSGCNYISNNHLIITNLGKVWHKNLLKSHYTKYTEIKMSPFWWNLYHWLHLKLSIWQLQPKLQPVIKISSKWQYFHFNVYQEILPC